MRLIRRMAQANVTWGAPRIGNELAKLGIEVAVSTVAKYMPRRRKPPSQTWRAFLENHLRDLVALDFFVVPLATFGVLFGLVVLAHHRRRVLHFNATAHPTVEWTARQLIQAFPEETAPRLLGRDRDKIYGERFRRALEVVGIAEVVTAARSPWQNPYAERLIGSLRRDCLDHVIVLDEAHLRRILAKYFAYYNGTRCHLSLAGDAPEAPGGPGAGVGRGGRDPGSGGTPPSIRAGGGVTWLDQLPTTRCPRADGVLGKDTGRLHGVSVTGDELFVHFGCLGHHPVPMARQPIVALSERAPAAVFVTASMAE